MSGFIYLSKAKFEEMKDDLHELKTVNRPELSQKISDARDFGDLKENAEYHAAREALSLLEAKIAKMEDSLARARIVDPKNITDDKVSIYTKVKLKDLKQNREVSYTLVSQEESDFKQAKISISSPVGKALLGMEKGEKVEIKVPAGIMAFQVLDIEVAI
ncbi:MAG TPA: transcription elongation factor GreA [Calditrichia bacterium]|nr:transcription elongation factor GreA [Calditrichota bacterium]HQV31079.1 transcription elongation factor GreA [Calditrichia bacterium]